MKFLKGMIIFTGVLASMAHAEGFRTGNNPSFYHTPIFTVSEMACSPQELKSVIAPDKSVITQLCKSQYSKCLSSGACLIENEAGERIGLSYYNYDEEANQSYFSKIILDKCAYGYGFGKVSSSLAGSTCLIPYFSVSADALEHKLGEVLFIPLLVGLQLPTGEIHDGYLIVTDFSRDSLGTGYDQFDFFTGTQSFHDPLNAFAKTTLRNMDNEFSYKMITGKKAEEIRKKRNFSILSTTKHRFKLKQNEMIGN